LIVYVPGANDGKRWIPPSFVVPVIEPATSTGLASVTDTPGHNPALLIRDFD